MDIAKKYELINPVNLNLHIVNPVLKIVKFFRIKTTFICEIYKNLEHLFFKNIFYLILGEFRNTREKTIHAEALVREDLWKQLKKKVIGKGFTWFIITPTNYDYCRTYFNLKMTKKEFSETLIKRLKFLKNKEENIQLHIHFTKDKRFLENRTQKDKFMEAMEFMNSQEIKPTKFVAGWWIFNKYTLGLLKKYGIKEVSNYTINPFLKKKSINGISITYVHKYWHDFDFL